MYNDTFYPTPDHVSAKMLACFSPKDLDNKYILEPSAGKGDLAEAISRRIKHNYGWANDDRFKNRIHCVEIHPELQDALRGKKFPIVGHDFLDYYPDQRYDHIIMNPPFNHGEDHLLHAWDILHGGRIVCLLNENCVINPDPTKKQLVIRALIKNHGEYELLGDCFNNEDAFRRTGVRIVMIILNKPVPECKFSFVNPDMDTERRTQFDFSNMENEITRRDLIADSVLRFKLAAQSAEKALTALAEFAYYSGGVADRVWESLEGPLKSILEIKNADAPALNGCYNDFLEDFKQSAWKTLMAKTKISGLLSSQVQNDFEDSIKQNSLLAFSERNIHAVIASIIASGPAIINQCIVEAFDHLTRYHKENRMGVEGWKTNDAWKVNRRAVLGSVVSCDYSVRFNYHRINGLYDLDRALAFLSGKPFNNILTIVNAFERHCSACGNSWNTRSFESEFFECRAYKKGSLHLFFKDEMLWERFNIEAARGKNWLPDDYKAREKEARAAAKNAAVNDPPIPLLALPCSGSPALGLVV